MSLAQTNDPGSRSKQGQMLVQRPFRQRHEEVYNSSDENL